jgi:hypothetical protein
MGQARDSVGDCPRSRGDVTGYDHQHNNDQHHDNDISADDESGGDDDRDAVDDTTVLYDGLSFMTATPGPAITRPQI